MLRRSLRYQSTKAASFYSFFPKTFPDGPPPKGRFNVDLKKLRKEYRQLQATSHPDVVGSSDDGDNSSILINKAYSTLKSPLSRSQYLLYTKKGLDLNAEEVQSKYQFQDKSLLLEILEIHEAMESVTNESELAVLEKENDVRIADCEKNLEQLYETENYEAIAIETIKLKYWFNIDNAIKEWEVGKPVQLTH